MLKAPPGAGHSGRRRTAVAAAIAAVTTAAVAACIFGLLIYLQGEQACGQLAQINTLEGLHEYLLRHGAASSRRPQDETLTGLAQQLQIAMTAVTRAPAMQQEALDLRKIITGQGAEVAALKDSAAKLQQSVDELQNERGTWRTGESQLKDQVEQLSRDKAAAEQGRAAAEKARADLESEKAALQQQLQQAGAAAAAAAGEAGGAAAGSAEAARFRALAVAGDSCGAVRGYEFHADPVVWGSDHKAADAAECCAACHAHRRAVARGGTGDGVNGTACNLWAFCGDADKCGSRLGECWLKAAAALPAPPELPPRAEASPGWTSGAVYEADQELEQYNDTALVLHTAHGDVEVALLPELAPTSVREIRRMAALLAPAGGVCSNCRIYRPEKDFLVQGIMEAPGGYVARPRHPNPPQKTTMERGLVCWAGGFGGPHWFVNLIDQSGFKDDHLCFGKVSASDMSVFDKIVTLPVKQKGKPDEMSALVEDVRFNMTLRAAAAATPTSSPAAGAAAAEAAPPSPANGTGGNSSGGT